MTLSEFGERLWQSGPEAAQKRLEEITLQGLHQLGISCEIARQWRDFHKGQSGRGRGLPTSLVRTRLLEKCLTLLGCPSNE